MIGRLLLRRRIHDDASAFVDGALSPRGHEAFARHLAVCAACQSEVTQLRDTKGMLKALGTEALPRSFTLSPALAARPASRPGPIADAAGWVGPGVPRLAASVSIMMAAALIAAVVIDLDDGPGTAVVQPASQVALQPVSQTAAVERAAPVVTESVASTATQVPEAGVRMESVLLVEGSDAPAASEQEAPRVEEVESAPAPELEEALEEVVEEAFVAAAPELLDIFLPGSDGFGSVALAASEAADDPASRADDITSEENVALGVAAIEAEAVTESDKETPVDAPGDDPLDGQAEPAAAVPTESSEDGGSSLGEGESALVHEEGEAALESSEDAGPSLGEDESALVHEEKETALDASGDGESLSAGDEEAETAPPADAGDVAVNAGASENDSARPVEDASSETAEPASGVSTDVPVGEGSSDELSGERSDAMEPSAGVASLDEPASGDADVPVADAETPAGGDPLAAPEMEDQAADARIPERPASQGTDPAVVPEPADALPSSAGPILDGAQDGGPEAVPIVASEPDGSQRGPAAAPTGRLAASADGEASIPWLRPLQMTLGIVAVFSAVLATVVWLRRRARSL
ncbi:MAG: zf-HC2 domain-containing protein [Chloroflexi bacterium]|nr:zf-HC2 domain-containing protein [Chloroflexota bacterium]